MKPLIPYAALFLLAASVAQSQEASKLPTASQAIKMKLETWENEKRASLESEIADQRQRVIVTLKAHLEQATRQGNLDGALAIRNYIESLNAEVLAEPNSPEAENHGESPSSTTAFEEWVTTVEFSDDHGTWVIEGDRLAQYVNDGRRLSYPLNPINAAKREVSFTGGGTGVTNYFRFERNFEKGERVIEPSGKTHKLEIKPKTKR